MNGNPATADCDADPTVAPGPASPAFNRVATLATRSRNDVVVLGP